MRIFIVGMPGCGKSYWGRIWAEAYGWNFYDLDEEIEQREGKSVDEIFKEDGELYFRSLEHAALINLIKNGTTPFILACGGGTPVFHHNLKDMQAAGCMAYLKTSVPKLLERLQADTKPRPLLTMLNVDTLERMLVAREPVYRKAAFTFDVAKLTENTFDTILEQCINQHL